MPSADDLKVQPRHLTSLWADTFAPKAAVFATHSRSVPDHHSAPVVISCAKRK